MWQDRAWTEPEQCKPRACTLQLGLKAVLDSVHSALALAPIRLRHLLLPFHLLRIVQSFTNNTQTSDPKVVWVV